MALNDEQVQELQVDVLKIIKEKNVNEQFGLERSGKEYQLINEVNETTQAIAVAPLDKKGHPDYSQTTIVVAGTQAFGGEINHHVAESFTNAFMAKGQLTAQTQDVRDFYAQSLKLAQKQAKGDEVIVSNMSGFSQSGPAVAKVAAENKVDRITNFMDWGSMSAIKDENGITIGEQFYLRRHLHSYSDAGKNTTEFDGYSGKIGYGQVFTVEGKKHSASLPKIKNNGLDINWYIKRNQFATGMTEEQVRKIAKYKAKKAARTVWNNPDTWFDSTDPESYVKEYLEKYGSFAPEPSKKELLSLNKKRIDELHTSLRTSSGSETISLREKLVRTSAQTAKLQAEVYEQEIKDKLASAQSKVEAHISELSNAAYTLAHNLSASEVEELLSELSLSKAWDEGTAASTLASAGAYTTKMTEIADNLNKASDRIIEIDQKGAQMFTTNQQNRRK